MLLHIIIYSRRACQTYHLLGFSVVRMLSYGVVTVKCNYFSRNPQETGILHEGERVRFPHIDFAACACFESDPCVSCASYRLSIHY